MNFSNVKADAPAPSAAPAGSGTGSTDKALAAIDKVVQGRRQPGPQRIHCPASFVGRLLRDHRAEVITPAEEKQLLEIWKQFNVTNAAYLQICEIDPKAQWMAQQDAFRDRINAGNIAEIHAVDGWTLKDHEEDRRQKKKSCGGENRRITALGLPVSRAMAKRTGVIAQREALELRNEEMNVAREWSIPFEPSRRLLMMESLAVYAETYVPEIPTRVPDLFAWTGLEFKI